MPTGPGRRGDVSTRRRAMRPRRVSRSPPTPGAPGRRGHRPPARAAPRAAARPASTIRSSWWNSRSPPPSTRAEDPLPGGGRLDGAAAADHHRPHQRLPEGGHAGAARAPTSPARTDVDRDDGSFVPLDQEVGRQVVQHPAVDEQPSVVLRQGREEHRQPRRGQGRVDHAPAAVHLAGAGHEVDAHHLQRRGRPSMTLSAPRLRTMALRTRWPFARDVVGSRQSLKGWRRTYSA